jgi:hypothetical protein
MGGTTGVLWVITMDLGGAVIAAGVTAMTCRRWLDKPGSGAAQWVILHARALP